MCKLGALIAGTYADAALDQQDRALVQQVLDTGVDHRGRTVSASLLSRALAANGCDVGATTVKDHRGRRCSCYREG